MPRADDPRVMVRLSPEQHATIKAAADIANVSLGGLIRECAVRHASEVAADVRRGTTIIRRQRVPAKGEPGPAAASADLMLARQRRINASTDRSRGVKP